MLHLLQVTSAAINRQIHLQAAYQIHQTPILIGSLRSYHILQRYNPLRANRILLPTTGVHHAAMVVLNMNLVSVMLVHDGLKKSLRQVINHFFLMLRIDAFLLDLPLYPPCGRYALDLKNIRLQNVMNLAHNNVHITAKYRFSIEEIRKILRKLRLEQFLRLRRHNVPNRVVYYIFNSEELLLYFLCRFAEGNSHVENGRFFGGDDLEQLACAEDLGADLSLRWPLVLREALYYWPWLRTIGATVVSAIFRNGRWREVANPKCVSKRARVVGSD
jgi:hypothetical protein